QPLCPSSPPPTCFNSAAGDHPAETPEQRGGGADDPPASIRPRVITPRKLDRAGTLPSASARFNSAAGDHPAETPGPSPSALLRWRFNSAAGDHPAETANYPGRQLLTAQLQFGRG